MSFDENKNDARRRSNGGGGPAGPDAAEGAGRSSRRRAPPNEVGDALKAAYNRALHEDIPPEMLDLLGKLG